jgi:hypothetical protein
VRGGATQSRPAARRSAGGHRRKPLRKVGGAFIRHIEQNFAELLEAELSKFGRRRLPVMMGGKAFGGCQNLSFAGHR